MSDTRIPRPSVVITGLGSVNPLGLDVQASWEAALAGRSGIRRIEAFDPVDAGLKVHIAGEVKGFDPRDYMDAKESKRMDRASQLAIAAAVQAFADSGLVMDDGVVAEAGAIIATGIGGITTSVEQTLVVVRSGPRRVSPFVIPMMMPNAAAGLVSIRLGLQGPSYCVSTACASSSDAIGIAMDMIRSGRARIMVVGGTDSTIVPLCIAGFEQAHALCTTFNDEPERASRPFDRDRSGFVPAEGAAVLVLEDAEFARARGARVYATIAGYGATADAYHMTAPDPQGRGAARAISDALRDSDADLTDVVYVNAHGTSTPLNDRTESFALETVFGERAAGIPVSSTKSMTGHMGGAAGAMEAIFCARAIEALRIPPTINQDTPDPDCRLDYVPWESRAIGPGVVLSNSFGFGGHNACLSLRSPPF